MARLNVILTLSLAAICLAQGFSRLVETGIEGEAEDLIDLDSTRRDASFQLLEDIFNSNSELFRRWTRPNGSIKDYEQFIEALTPWVVSDLPEPYVVTERPIPIGRRNLNCADPKYSTVLTGKRLKNHRLIVDFIPFGYDIEKLEIRLFELDEVVDTFVLYEAPYTQSGIEKPLFFSMVKNSSRFDRWRDRIIHLMGTKGELEEFRERTMSGSDFLSLEASMRTEMIRKFKKLNAAKHPLKDNLMANLQRVYGLQNDGDEIPVGEAVFHLKHCQLKPEANDDRIYFPAFSFKKNFHWLQRTYDLANMTGGNVDDTTWVITNFLWRPGPVAWPLSKMLQIGSTGRLHISPELDRFSLHHLGLGSATHMSSVADPGEYLLKRGGVIEQNFQQTLSKRVLDAAATGSVTANILAEEFLRPWCHQENAMYFAQDALAFAAPSRKSRKLGNSKISRDDYDEEEEEKEEAEEREEHEDVNRLTEEEAHRNIEIWMRSFPWVVRYNPSSYPFLIPNPPMEHFSSLWRKDLENPSVSPSAAKQLRQQLTNAKKQLARKSREEEDEQIADYLEPTGHEDWADLCATPKYTNEGY